MTLPAQYASMHDFYQLVHDVAPEAVDHQQPFQSLPEVAQELTLQTDIPCLAVKTTKNHGSQTSGWVGEREKCYPNIEPKF